MKFLRAIFSLTLVATLFTAAWQPLLAQNTGQGATNGAPSGNTVVVGREQINLMAPIQDLISGPGWLMARGMDVRPNGEMLEWNPLTRQPLEQLANPMAGLNAPLNQGGGPGVLVPYRDPAPSFSRTLLGTRDYSGRTLQTEPDIAVNPLDPDHFL